jgi:ankyrin repeat protein
LISSARLFRLDLVTVLAQNIDKENFGCVSLAFDALLSTDGPDPSSPGDVWLFNPDALDILQILVNMGANGESAQDALVRAAQSGNIGAVDILAQVVDDPLIFTNAFNAMTASGSLWLDNDYFDLVATLLSRGAADEGVHYALASALTYVIDGLASQELLELLLEHNADVNFDHGKSLQLATHHARQDLFEMLLQRNPDPHSLYMSLQTALSNDHEEETVFRLFKSVTENESVRTKPDVNNHSDLGFPLLFYCLNNYPASARLVKEICELNADLSATIVWEMHEDEYDDPLSDRLPPLFVSLEKNCSDEVIDVLLAYGAEINFTPEQSQASALMLAAGKRRASVVSTLIDRGASVIQKDARGRTPLFYAARNGDLLTLKSILKKNPPRNDGSLHEAARELHADAVKLLVKSGHDIQFPSSKHGGRSPLCELCYASKGSQDPVGLQKTLTELAAAKAEPLRKSRGRTALFMAMENANPSPVVTALIEVCLWRDLNDPQNIYEEGDYFYSPTMYIKKGIIRQSEVTANEILEKLQDFSAADRYYAKERMQQPKDAVGMPQLLLDLDHKKWIRSSRLEEEEEDFERKLKRADQEAANRQLLSQRQHLMLMEQRENMGQQQSTHALDTHLLSMRLRDREHNTRLVHQDELYDHHLGEMASENQMKQNIEAAQHEIKFGMQQQSRDAQLVHDSRTQEQKLGYLGQEHGMRYSGLEAQQNLRLEGISSELELKRQQQMDDLRFRESRSGVDRADLDHKLQHTNEMNTERVQLDRELGDIELASRQNKNLLEDENRQSQLQHQFATDERKISTQSAMNQQEYARNQDSINTRRTQSQIDRDTRAALGQIEHDTMYDKFQMTQQDRGHKLETESRMGQIQNRNLQDKFGTQLNYLQTSNQEKLGFQQATNQQKLGFQQTFDRQKLQTLDVEGRIQNNTLQNRNIINLDYQHRSSNMKLGQQAQSKRIDLDYQHRSGNMRLQQQAQANNLDRQKQSYSHNNKISEYAAQDYLIGRRVQGAAVTQHIQNTGNRLKHEENLQYKSLGG